jgi:hypothetical protein
MAPTAVGRVPEDSLVRRLVPDPADPPGLRCLAGYLGRSPRRRYFRIYLDCDLGTWIEVHEEDYVDTAQPSASAPLGTPSLIWLRAGARVQPQPDSHGVRTLEEYFVGDMYRKQFADLHLEGGPSMNHDAWTGVGWGDPPRPPRETSRNSINPCK